MSDSPFLQVTASILATIQQNAEFVRARLPAHELPKSVPLFDPRPLPPSHREDATVIFNRVSSLGIPDALASEVIALLSEHSTGYQSSVDQAQHRLLHDLSTTTTSLNPALLPSLIAAACGTFYNATLDSGLHSVKDQLHVLNTGDQSQSDPEESDSDSDSEGSGDDDESIDQDEENADPEDENAPIKPGEEVPPLETKYLPIFEALHERGKVLTKPEKTYLVNMTGMTYRQITIWFQNRRRGELKENSNTLAYSHASSVHSDDSSESDNEVKLEEQLNGFQQSDTTFSIRSWQLASAAAGPQDANAPPSPTKYGFGIVPNTESDDDSDLSDTEDEADVPPGLHVPSLAMSISTLDSNSDRGPPTITSDHPLKSSSGLFPGPVIEGDKNSATGTNFSRPIKSLPAPRRQSPPTHPQPTQHARLPSTFTFTAGTPTPNQTQPLPSSNPESAQLVTSNERGLTVEMNSTLPTSTALTTTLRSSPTPPFSVSNTGTPPSLSPQPVAGSPRSSSSPSRQSTISPRPAIKPLPRRTGCAPRPRPPPRAVPVSTSASTSGPTSGRPSVVLPPASNPSLASTTLGALLRPNPPAPAIPSEMEERLSAMAGRMGVGSSSALAGHRPATDNTSTRASISAGINGFPHQGSSFTFGSTNPGALAGRGFNATSVPQPDQTGSQSAAS